MSEAVILYIVVPSLLSLGYFGVARAAPGCGAVLEQENCRHSDSRLQYGLSPHYNENHSTHTTRPVTAPSLRKWEKKTPSHVFISLVF